MFQTHLLSSRFRIVDDGFGMMDQLFEHAVPVLLSLQDLDLDAEVSDRNLLIHHPGHADRILFGGQDTGDPASFAAFDEAVEFPF